MQSSILYAAFLGGREAYQNIIKIIYIKVIVSLL
jgi:hypothetical protein